MRVRSEPWISPIKAAAHAPVIVIQHNGFPVYTTQKLRTSDLHLRLFKSGDSRICNGKKITTVEGLAHGEKLDSVQQAFLEVEAFQCGYCTPGMIVSAAALLKRNPHPSDQQIISHMDGNVCRCGTYGRIIEAVHRAAELRRSEKNG